MDDIKKLKSFIPRVGIVFAVTFAASLLTAVLLAAFRFLSGFLFTIVDRPAFTSGDLPYLLRSWQGILLVVVGIAILFVYVAMDLNIKILLSRQLVRGEKIDLKEIFSRAFLNLKKLLCPRGLLIVLYCAFIVPLCGGVFRLSLTSTFRIPEFILSVINSTPVFYLLYWAFLLLSLYAGIAYSFTFFYINIERKSAKAAMKAAFRLWKENRRNFFERLLPFTLILFSILIIVVLFLVGFPVWLISSVAIGKTVYRFLLLFFMGTGVIVITAAASFFIMAFLIEMTMLYEEYNGRQIHYDNKLLNVSRASMIAIAGVILLAISAAFLSADFDRFFPAFEDGSIIIAHRGAGNLTSENTLEAIELGAKLSVDAAEIDIQRTGDGEYILNHDDNFFRLAGDDRTPEELTLSEIKQLRMHDGSQFASFPEILDAAKDKVHLYVELKGKTADRQMVDDVYKMIADKDMLDQCSLISLDYDIIEYAEETYSDIDTVYLLYFGFGDLGNLKCDRLGLEQETATAQNVEKVHQAGKKVDVWTCNSLTGMISAISAGADGLITDKPVMLSLLKIVELLTDSDLLRVLNVILPDI